MKKYMQLIAISLITLLSFSKVVHADAINLSLVNTQYDYSFPATVFLDDSSMGFGIGYSFQINPMFSVDLNYTDHGSAKQTVLFINTEVETTSLSVALRGSAVAGTVSSHDVYVHGLIGLTMAEMDLTVGGASLTDSDTGLILGAGVSVMLSAVDELSLMYKRSDLDFDNTVAFEYNPTTMELGYSHRF